MNTKVRKPIRRKLTLTTRYNPARLVKAITGIRIYDVGQGDAICVLNHQRKPFFRIDYGGLMGNDMATATQVDERMGVGERELIMLTHWDVDHWWSARRGNSARKAWWYVPRQTTSPRAVQFSATLPRIACVPEALGSNVVRFKAQNGDEIWFQKLRKWPGPEALDEDCNLSGIAFSILKKRPHGAPDEVILLPGDAPFQNIGHYQDHIQAGCQLRGMVAFHHGSHIHFEPATTAFLNQWTHVADPSLVFSYAMGNPNNHPTRANYATFGPTHWVDTAQERLNGRSEHDILF